MTVDFNVIEQSTDVVFGKMRAKPLINKSTRYVYGCGLVLPCKILIKNPTMFTRKWLNIRYVARLLAAYHTNQPVQHSRILQGRLAFIKAGQRIGKHAVAHGRFAHCVHIKGGTLQHNRGGRGRYFSAAAAHNTTQGHRALPIGNHNIIWCQLNCLATQQRQRFALPRHTRAKLPALERIVIIRMGWLGRH